MRCEDLTGQRFYRLLVIKRNETNTKSGGALWICQCDCGNTTIVSTDRLKNGHTKSCGCLHKEQITKLGHETGKVNIIKAQKASIKHGEHRTRLYRIWQCMKTRVTNMNRDESERYSKRGITICEEWANSYESFRDWAIANGYQDNLTIDRIDNNKGYDPSNCRWADRTTQNNNRSNNVILEYNGKSLTVAEWSKETGINYETLRYRIEIGWNVEDILTKPVRGHK